VEVDVRRGNDERKWEVEKDRGLWKLEMMLENVDRKSSAEGCGNIQCST
jgi:hypothetical protein